MAGRSSLACDPAASWSQRASTRSPSRSATLCHGVAVSTARTFMESPTPTGRALPTYRSASVRRSPLCQFARLEGGIRNQFMKGHLNAALTTTIFQNDLERAQQTAIRRKRSPVRLTHGTEILVLDRGVDLACVREPIFLDDQERLSVKPQPTMDEHAAVGRGPGDLEPVPIRIFDHLGSLISVDRTGSEYASHRPDL